VSDLDRIVREGSRLAASRRRAPLNPAPELVWPQRLPGAVILLIAIGAANLNLQSSPVRAALPLAILFVSVFLWTGRSLAFVAATLPLLPILANCASGPWLAPAELVILVSAAAYLLRGHSTLRPGRLSRSIAIAVGASAVGSVAAILAALPFYAIPSAIADLVRNVFAPDVQHAALPVRSLLIVASALFGYAALRRSAADHSAKRVLLLLIGSASAVALYGILEAIFDWKLWPVERYEIASGFHRVISTLSDYNSAGSFLALFLFPAAALAASGRRWGRVLGIAATLLLSICLLLTGSRSAWVAVALVGGIVFVITLRRTGSEGAPRPRAGALGLGAAIVISSLALGVMYWPGETGRVVQERARSLGSPVLAAESILQGRVGFWKAGLRMLRAHPLAGVGPGRVPSRFAEFKDRGFPIAAENIHSYPLQCLDENGLVGGLLLLWPFASLLPLLWWGFRGRTTDPVVLALAPGITAFAISGLSAHPWLLPEMQIAFWGAAAVLEAGLEQGGEPLLPGRKAFTVLALFLLTVWGGARLLAAPGSESGRFGYGSWGWGEGKSQRQWIGPASLLSFPRAPGVTAGVIPVRRTAAPGATIPIELRARFDGGRWVVVTLGDRDWHSLVVPLEPLRAGAELPSRVLCEIRASHPFCPATSGGNDRRILGVELGRPRALWPEETLAPQ